MSDGLVAALVAGFVAITVAWLTQFVAEAYKRHRDGSAVAAAIAGEMASYVPAWPQLMATFEVWIKLLQKGQRDQISLRPFKRPEDMVIDEMVPKLGLLTTKQVEDVVSAYSNIRAFRDALMAVTTEHQSMSDAELNTRILAMISSLDRARVAGERVLPELHKRAEAPFWPWASKARIVGLATLCGLLLWFGASLVRVENQRYALEVGLCKSDPLKLAEGAKCLKAVESRNTWWWHLLHALRGS